ncbi:MAG: SPASM domain-containing protein [Bacteroidia bacterium]
MWKARFKDGIEFAQKFTMPRSINAAKTLASYYYSRVTRNAVHWGYPISISIEPTTSCNLRCPECPSGLRAFSRATGMLQKDTFTNVIDQVSKYTPYLILYFQGEPYLNKQFFDYVIYAAAKKMYVATSTNAHYLTDENAKKTVESGLSRLIISIDGTTQETYKSYRIGGNLDKVLAGAKRVVEWKKKLKSSTPHIIFQFLVVKPNEHQTDDVLKMAKEMGIDEVKFKTAQVYDYENGNELIPENEKYSRYRKNKKTGKYEIKNPLLNHCWKLWQSCVFTWDGKVVPCCFDKDASHTMGDIQQQTFIELWQSDRYQNFRNSVLRSRKEIDICQNCTEGGQVWI